MPRRDSWNGLNPRIVVIGGGTGTYTALVGLKQHRVRLTAIVSMADDGGSSGRLRDELGVLPPGDVRRCLLALSAESSGALRALFNYRFDRGNGLAGHSFGNLFLAALSELTGSADLAIREAARLLHVRGEVLPVTLMDSRLCAELDDGSVIHGETHIDIRAEHADRRISRIFLDPAAWAHPAALAAIEQADVVVIGPGDLYTSVLPNLLVRGIAAAIVAAQATKVYVCNVMTKHGETDGYRASDFVREIQRYLGSPNALDHAIVNDGSSFPSALLARYAAEQAYPVEADVERCRDLGVRPHLAAVGAAGNLLRHDPARLADAILQLARQSSGPDRLSSAVAALPGGSTLLA